MIPFGPGRLQGCDASHRAALSSPHRASWFSHSLLSSSNCAALSSTCRASLLLHRLSSSSHCVALSLSCHTSWLSHCISPSSRCTSLSSTRHASLFSHRLSSSSCCTPRDPLVLSLRRLVVASPLDAPPSIVSLSRCAASCCLFAPAGCRAIISCRPLVAPPYNLLIVLAGCCVACPCAALSSSCRIGCAFL